MRDVTAASNCTQEVLVWERVIAYLFLGKCPVTRVSAHPPTFVAELQASMAACPGEYGNYMMSRT